MSTRIKAVVAIEPNGTVICPVVAEEKWQKGKSLGGRVSVGTFYVSAKNVEIFLLEQKKLIQKYSV